MKIPIDTLHEECHSHYMSKGTRVIEGREYLLAGRVSTPEAAKAKRDSLKPSWHKVRIIKLWAYDYMLYVHAAK